jgi:hypothetical protein
MPRVEPAEYEALPLEAHRFAREFAPLHDVWLVELEGGGQRTVPELRSALPEHLATLPLRVRALFALRSTLGRIFGLDPVSRGADGAFELVYMKDDEAAYRVRNATVHAIVAVALTRSEMGQRFYWATYVRPVGRITPLYMGLIDPFRRWIVYPGLESWLGRAWRSLATE